MSKLRAKLTRSPEVHSLYRRGAGYLAGELVSASRIASISNDEHGLFLTNCTGLCGGSPLLVRVAQLVAAPTEPRSVHLAGLSPAQLATGLVSLEASGQVARHWHFANAKVSQAFPWRGIALQHEPASGLVGYLQIRIWPAWGHRVLRRAILLTSHRRWHAELGYSLGTRQRSSGSTLPAARRLCVQPARAGTRQFVWPGSRSGASH